MSSEDRELFLKVVKENSTSEIIKLVLGQKSNKKRFDLKEVVSSLSSGAIDDVWNCLQELCTLNLLPALCTENEEITQGNLKTEEEINEAREVLLAIIEIAKETVTGSVCPGGLLQTVIVLNGVLVSFPEDAGKLKQAIAQLCVQWINSRMESYEILGSQTVLFYIRKSLHKGTRTDLKMLYSLREYLPELIIHGNENQKMLEDLLISCVACATHVSCPTGVNFLAYLMTLSENLTKKLHNAMKYSLANCTRRHAAAYGLVYLKAWQTAKDNLKQVLEIECIQDLMHHAVHADRSIKNSVAPNFLSLLNILHKETKNPSISKLLYELYEPILWRALKVTNGYVRCNAASLFFDAFPLENPEMNNEDGSAMFHKQIQFVESLLDDECAIVRNISIYGTFSLLYKHWELLPATSIKEYINKVSDLAFDGSSVECRLAVFKGFAKLVENPLSHPLLRVLLPSLQLSFHDPSEKVRLAFCDMLLSVKNLKSIKFWSIVPPDHLLARLATDNPSICRRIVTLIFNSYFPILKQDSVKIDRAISLVETNKLASRRFYQIMPQQTDLESVVNFMLLICKALKVFVRQRSSENNENSMLDSTQDKENLSTSSDQLSLPEYNDMSFPFNNPDIVSGLVDAVTILWKEIYSQIYQRSNSTLLKALHRAYSNAVPLFFMYFKDSIVNESLVYLSSLLPVKAVPMVSSHCMSKLKNLTEEQSCGQPHMYSTLLESMCNWGKANLVLETISEWMQEGLKDEAPTQLKNNRQNTKKKGVLFQSPVCSQPLLGIEFLTFMLCHPVCKKILVEGHRTALLEVQEHVSKVLQVVEKMLNGQTCNVSAVLAQESFLLFVKLQLLLNKKQYHEDLESLIVYWHRVIYPCLNRPTEDAPAGFAKRQQLAIKLTQMVANIACNSIAINACPENSVQSVSAFAIQLLETDVGEMLLLEFVDVMRDISEYSLKALEDVSSCAKLVPSLLDKFITVFNKSVKNNSPVLQDTEKLTANMNHILKLFRYDASSYSIYSNLMASLTTAIVAEITAYILQDDYEKPFEVIDDFPPLSAWIMSVLCNRINILRDFVNEVCACVQSGAVKGFPGILAVSLVTKTLSKIAADKLGTSSPKELIISVKKLIDKHQDDEEAHDNINYITAFNKIISGLRQEYLSDS